jgi:hypothetical protein
LKARISKGILNSLHNKLDEFAKTYQPSLKVRFTDRLGAAAQSDLQRGIIYLARKQELDPDAIGLGLSYAYRIGPKYRRMKITREEMYFLTLLHEIGHFKIKEKIPKNYIQLRRDIVGDGRSDSFIELSYIEGRIKRRAGEKESAWKLRLADFMSWLATGETISHHIRVENWAIDEFERKRKSIDKRILEAEILP